MESLIIPGIRYYIRLFHRTAGRYDCSSCFFFVCVCLSPDLHYEFLRICDLICLVVPHICFKCFNLAFKNRDLFRINLCDIVFQTVLITGMICFQKFQLCHLYIKVHLFLDLRVVRSQSLHLSRRKLRSVHIFTASHR